jgi:hypothetical protein
MNSNNRITGIGIATELERKLRVAEAQLAEYDTMRAEYMLLLNYLLDKTPKHKLTIQRAEIHDLMKRQDGKIRPCCSNISDPKTWTIEFADGENVKPSIILPS